MYKIPFNRPSITDLEKKFVFEALSQEKICGDGKFTKQANQFMEQKFNVQKALLTTSCTHALEMSAMLIDLKAGDEVILPSYTFVSTANPILLRGATPVFIDVEPATMNMDPEKIAEKINKNTKAIFVVHYAGVSCDMDAIMKLAKDNNLFVVEDAAQGVNSKYKGAYLGSIGDFAAYSFHETKNYVCGEGGSLLINNKNKSFMEKAEIIREKGTNRSMFYRGEVDKYSWQDVGSSYLPSEVLAAMLCAQFERMDEIQSKRENIYFSYYNGLKDLANKEYITLPFIPDYAESNYHMFFMLCQSEDMRNGLMAKLKERGITSVFHYIPLHSSPVGLKLGYKHGDLPLTENLSGRLIRLPMYADLTQPEQQYVIESIHDVLNNWR